MVIILIFVLIKCLLALGNIVQSQTLTHTYIQVVRYQLAHLYSAVQAPFLLFFLVQLLNALLVRYAEGAQYMQC